MRSVHPLIVVALVFPLGCTSIQKDSPLVIEAERYVLKDRGGRVSAMMETVGGSPRLGLYGWSGMPRAILEVLGDTPRFSLLDTMGETRISLGFNVAGWPEIMVSGGAEEGNIVITMGDGTGGVWVRNPIKVWGILFSKDVQAVVIRDEEGNCVDLGVPVGGDPSLILRKSDGTMLYKAPPE